MPKSAKGADARRQTAKRVALSSGGVPHTAPVLREVLKDAKGADARRQTAKKLNIPQADAPDGAGVLHEFVKHPKAAAANAAKNALAEKAPGELIRMKPKNAPDSIAGHMESVLRELGEDITRDGLIQTPARIEKALRYLTSGYAADPKQIVNGALFEVDYDEIVLVRDIEFFSMCEHHMLPFYGKMHVAYIARNKVIGLSKLPRIVDAFARRLQIQERLTQQVAESLQELLDPEGVGVVCEAQHFCMMMRGVQKQHSDTVTSAMLGAFREQKQTRDEFLALIQQRRG
jgi:GTP cyclohydrolase I